MVKQGWARKEKAVAPVCNIVVPEGIMKPTEKEFSVNIDITKTYSFYSVTVFGHDAITTKDAIIRGFVDGQKPSYKAVMSAFSDIWNRGLISGRYFDHDESIRKRLNDEFVSDITRLDNDVDRRGDTITNVESKQFMAYVDDRNCITRWEEI